MRLVFNFIGGAGFALGLCLFLYGAFSLMAINVVTQFGYTEIRSTYEAVKSEYFGFQIIGTVVAMIGAGLASIHRD